MNMVSILGNIELLHGLDDIVGLDIVHKTAMLLENGDYSVAAYATDAGIVDAESRGASVDIVMDNTALSAHYEELDSILAAKDPVA